MTASAGALGRLRAVMDLLPVGVVIVEGTDAATAVVTDANPAFAALMGIDFESGTPLEALSYRVFRPDRTTEVPVAEMPGPRAIRLGAEVQGVELHILRPDGKWRVVLASASPLPREPAGSHAAAVVLQDITEERQREESAALHAAQLLDELRARRDLLDSIIENAPAIVAVVEGPEHRYTLVNSRFLTAAEDRTIEILGQPLAEVWPEHAERVVPLFDRVRATGQPFRTTDERFDIVRHGERESVYVTFSLVPLRGTDRILAVAFETTAQVRARDEITALVARVAAERARLQEVIARMPVGVLIAEAPSGRVIVANDEVSRIWRQPFPAGSTGYDVFDGYHGDGRPYLTDEWPVARSLTTGEVVRGETIAFLRGDGRCGTLLVSAAPIRDHAGKVTAAVAVLQDVTDARRIERELRASEERFRTLAENAPDLITRFDRELRALFVNRELERVTGVPVERIVGRTGAEVGFAPDVVRLFETNVRRVFESGEPRTIEFEAEGPRGLRFMEARLVPERGRADQVESVLSIARDVTERRRMEEALREVDRRKDEFIAVLSHELRNPLMPIRNSLYLLDRAVAGGEQARRAKAVLDRQVAHLSRLVDDLLDVSRISRGKIQLQRERLELGALIHRTVEDHRAAFADAGVELLVHDAPEELWVDGDPTRLAQIAGNLLGNAVKFTPRGGRVDVDLARDGATAILRVRDTGVGIAPELLGRLFEPFTQADRTLDRSRGGLGLGLALVRGLTELHGGTVAAASAGPGEGTELTVRLPLAAAPGAEVAPSLAPAAAGRRRVLVIEDNADAAESLCSVLELMGHEVRIAGDGPAGIAAAEEFRPEIILCDIGLPEMDGYEVARRLRARPEHRGVTLVALTGYALPDDRRRAAEAGFAHHLAKPLDLGALVRLLAEAPRR